MFCFINCQIWFHASLFFSQGNQTTEMEVPAPILELGRDCDHRPLVDFFWSPALLPGRGEGDDESDQRLL